jgi:lysyl-tRNA synthetase class I
MAPRDPDDEPIEVRCPKCGKTVRVARRDAERSMTVRCPAGHDVPLVKIL